VLKPAGRSRPEPYVGLVGDHADKLSRIQPISHAEDDEPVGPAPRPPRVKARWFFLAALVLAVLAFWILPTPFSGFAALLCVGAFISGGGALIKGGDPEMVKRVTTGGFIGGGG
jgi:hypothetical protein